MVSHRNKAEWVLSMDVGEYDGYDSQAFIENAKMMRKRNLYDYEDESLYISVVRFIGQLYCVPQGTFDS